jgi:hypothetical protein
MFPKIHCPRKNEIIRKLLQKKNNFADRKKRGIGVCGCLFAPVVFSNGNLIL